jgi:5'(3')-deoxyribonucleotidase
MKTIALDMDGCLVDFIGRYLKNLADDGIFVDENEVTHYDIPTAVEAACGVKIEFNKYLDPDFFLYAAPYRGAVRAVAELMDWYRVVFVTKTYGMKHARHKATWLKQYFKKKKYELVCVGDNKSKGLIQADFLVDDHPEVIAAVKSPVVPILVSRPWNQDFDFDERIGGLQDLLDTIFFHGG